MPKAIRQTVNALLVAIPIIFSAAPLHAAVPTSSDYTLKPPVLVRTETPLVMLGLSVDHQLSYKAYSDYADITGDGNLDIDYEDSFDYFGYFDSDWCYEYDTSSNVFVPSSSANGLSATPKTHTCSGSKEWSGNLLNWATMTRLDILRGVLYGGKRTSAETVSGAGAVLERAYIPNDNHAFAKVIKTNVSDFTPFSSPFTICNLSTSTTSGPIFRIASGEYRRWSINESLQCGFDSKANSPDTLTDYRTPNGVATTSPSEAQATVRVAKCVAGKDENSTACRQYIDSSGVSYKRPTGLLQEYGENGDLRFGLISGSYQKNIEGGALRKTISLITDEVDINTGIFIPGAAGIIDTIDKIRIANWGGTKYSDCTTHSIAISTFKASVAGNYKCSDWGNPVTEIYLEALRFFAGQTTAAFEVTSDFLGASATWPNTVGANPLNNTNFCADCSIIMLSSGANSFDSDNLDQASGIPGLGGAADVYAKTNIVAALENITGNYVVSDDTATTTDDDGYCTSKGISNLSNVRGVCPEVPKLEGGYNVAGLAYHAKTTDLRTDSGMDDDQTVSTFAVELSESLPRFSVGISEGKSIDFVPACESKPRGSADSNYKPCSLFDVEVLELVTGVNADGKKEIRKGRFIFHWEDSPWGNDYDIDISQVVWVCAGSYCDNADTAAVATWDNAVASDQVRITTGIAYLAAGNDLKVNYAVNGSTNDGLPSNWMLKQKNQGFWEGASSATYPGFHEPVTNVYRYGTSAAGSLKRPLWYAAKYGGFTDTDGNNKPSIDTDPTNTKEWDSTNNRTGAAGADGIPDNYFLASNPSLLRTQLQRVFDTLVARTASGTNAAVVSNSSSGVGAIYQALYQPLVRAGSSSVSWVGTLQAIFIDGNGFFREDSNRNGMLDGYDKDYIITLSYDSSRKKTMLQRHTYNSTSKTKVPFGELLEVTELQPMWSAVESLACFPNASAKVQRALTTKAHEKDCSSGGRHIFTWLETTASGTRDGLVDSSEVVDFLSSTFSSGDLYRWLDVPDATAATSLVDYIRGYDNSAVTGFRNRRLNKDLNRDSVIDGNDIWRLGDIIHSTPAVVASPSGAYDTTHSDKTYAAFFKRYQSRRQMVYVGGNDGMLHAFNGGFWDPLNSEFSTSGKTPDDTTAVEHPLGAEVWAYVPQNLLPHLKWLAEPNYPHVYYVDGAPLVFDANIFATDTDHPHGWGTVMVVGMNFGGGDYALDLDGDGIYGEATDDYTTRSAYIIMDITNPEKPPKVLAEIQSSDLGFTTSMPTVVKKRVPTVNTDNTEDWESPASNEWFLVFGSGPHGSEALSKGKSDQTSNVKMLNLKTLGTTGSIAVTTISTGDALSSVGDLHTADWNRDLVDDVVYFGTAGWDSGSSAHTGNLKRLKLNTTNLTSSTVNTMAAMQRPIVAAPLTALGADSKRWVMAGTGRLHVANDNAISQQQYFFSVYEPKASDNTYAHTGLVSTNRSNLEDTTNVRIFGDGSIKTTTGGVYAISGTTIDTMTQMKNEIAANYNGWYVKLEKDGSNPSGRVTHQATLDPANRGFMAFTEYVPPGGVCEIDGESFLWELAYEAGISGDFAPLGHDTITPKNGEEIASAPKLSIGAGQASKVVFHQGIEGNLVAITNLSTGSIEGTEVKVGNPGYGRQSWRQIDMSGF